MDSLIKSLTFVPINESEKTAMSALPDFTGTYKLKCHQFVKIAKFYNFMATPILCNSNVKIISLTFFISATVTSLLTATKSKECTLLGTLLPSFAFPQPKSTTIKLLGLKKQNE